jgi:hypothetical protein
MGDLWEWGTCLMHELRVGFQFSLIQPLWVLPDVAHMAMLLKDEELRDHMILRWWKMRTSWKIANSCKRCGTPLQIIIPNYSLQSPPLLVYNLSLSALHILGTPHFWNKWTLVSSQASAYFRMPHSGHYVLIRCTNYFSCCSGLLSISNAPPINMKITT